MIQGLSAAQTWFAGKAQAAAGWRGGSAHPDFFAANIRSSINGSVHTSNLPGTFKLGIPK
jgi:hypothetical protein